MRSLEFGTMPRSRGETPNLRHDALYKPEPSVVLVVPQSQERTYLPTLGQSTLRLAELFHAPFRLRFLHGPSERLRGLHADSPALVHTVHDAPCGLYGACAGSYALQPPLHLPDGAVSAGIVSTCHCLPEGGNLEEKKEHHETGNSLFACSRKDG